MGPAPVTRSEFPSLRVTVLRPGNDADGFTFDDCCSTCEGRVLDLLAQAAGKPLPARQRRARKASRGAA